MLFRNMVDLTLALANSNQEDNHETAPKTEGEKKEKLAPDPERNPKGECHGQADHVKK
jgi:hypothetical protein